MRRGAARHGFAIGARAVGDGHPCLVVGEVAQAHDGSLGMAHAFVDAIADAGADAVKFQTHIAAAESTPGEPLRVPGPQDASRYEYWRRMEFTAAQWDGLRRHADERGLIFLSSPFSIEAAEVLGRCGMPAWKIGSGELLHHALIDHVARTGRPVILSTGMASWCEIEEAVVRVRARGAPVAVLQCTSKYPTPPEDVGVSLLPRLRQAFACAVGLSDHSGTPYPGLVAAALGASIVEVHVTLSREMYGPDVTASVTTQELRDLVRGIRFVERMMAHPTDKDAMVGQLTAMRHAFSRSIVAGRFFPAGTVLTESDLALKKPGSGLAPHHLSSLPGRRVTRDIARDEPLRWDDVAPPLAPEGTHCTTTHDDDGTFHRS